MKFPEIAGEYAQYFDYIMSLVGGGELWDGFEMQLSRLFERKYYFINPINENLVSDVENLRADFVDGSYILNSVTPIGEASVLEVLVVLAIKIDRDVMDNPRFGSESRADMWFKEIFEAAGFDCDGEEIDEKIDDLLDERVALCSNARPFQSLWEQANVLFLPRFELENEEFPV
jgi:hypothetical protein